MTAIKTNSTHEIIEQMIRLRVLVGYLGEKRQAGWWDCGFLDSTGKRFLEATFPRTFACAALRSTTEAARLVHDSHIGRVGVFHLFRLPVDIEDQLEAHVAELVSGAERAMTLTWDGALRELAEFAEVRLIAPRGPVQVGVEKKILTATAVSELAAHYLSAFGGRFLSFPYFTSNTNGRR